MTARPIPLSTRRAAAPALFRSARASRDLPLIAFAVALFVAFVAHAGAFLPRIDGLPGARPEAPTASARTQPAGGRALACEATGVGAPHC